VPDELADIIDRLLEKKPSRRFASAEELRQRLARLLSQVQQFGPSRRRFSGWRHKRGRRKLLAGFSLLATIAVATGAAVWFAESARDRATSQASLTESFTGSESEFFASLEATRQTLNSATRDRMYIRAGDDAWQREIESLQRDLKKIESTNR
jgi:hypothetical protein